MNTANTANISLRRDIQVLRGISVLLVVLYHADTGLFDKGYLGVDVFFVISGFLITKIILQGLDRGDFSFVAFYLRRAKRLLPALYSTLLFTALLAGSMLSPADLYNFKEQLFGSLTFSANMVLPLQTAYFDREVESKPLLHIWSLSLEEQYYLVLPIFLFLIPVFLRFAALIIVLLSSLTLCLIWVDSSGPAPLLWRLDPHVPVNEWAFYVLPTRAWELLTGSACAFFILRHGAVRLPIAVSWSALLAILATAMAGFDHPHPRGDAMIVVMATSLLMIGNDTWLPEVSFVRTLEHIGNWSYSLYLVHWPLLAYAYFAFLGDIDPAVKLLLVLLSVLLAYLQYRYVEVPFRYRWRVKSKQVWVRLSIATAALAALPFVTFGHSDTEYAQGNRITEMRARNFGLSIDCDNSFEGDVLKSNCISGDSPWLAVWGDSFAMHFAPGVSASNIDFVQLTQSACAPIARTALVFGRYNEAWAKNCLLHNETAIDFVASNESITHVLLGSPFIYHFGDRKQNKLFVDGRIQEKDDRVSYKYFVETITRLKEAGKTPILITPPPADGHDIGMCMERGELGLIKFRSNCDIDQFRHQAWYKDTLDVLARIADEQAIKLIRLEDLMCEDGTCRTQWKDIFLYRDKGHLSIKGSAVLFQELGLGKMLKELNEAPAATGAD